MSINKEGVTSVMKGSLSLVGEFKQFISRGNVVDLAVGVIIGGAFGQITTSLVKDVIMPPIGYFASGLDFSSIKYVLHTAVVDPKDPTKVLNPEVAIGYGAFINTVINFLIVAFAVFWLVKAINMLKRKEAEAPSAPPTPSAEETLLTEIRDLLAKK